MIEVFLEDTEIALNSTAAGEFHDILRRFATRGKAEVLELLASGNTSKAEQAAAEWIADMRDVRIIISGGKE